MPELARLNKQLTDEQNEFWENVAKPKDQRRAGLTKEYMETTQGLLECSTISGTSWPPPSTTRMPTIDQLLTIKQTAWLLRNTAGEGSLIVSIGLPPARSRRKPATTTPICRRHERMWKALELSTSGMQLPPALATAMAGAKTAYFDPQYLALRDRLRMRWSRARRPR